MQNAKYLKIEAGVRYWGDATVNGISPEDGSHVPFKFGDVWCPIIDITEGKVVDWPEGCVADFHFKVCDSGSYYLLNESMEVIAGRLDDYVPDGVCHGDNGYGDYIIFSVDGSGKIGKYRNGIDFEDFDPV